MTSLYWAVAIPSLFRNTPDRRQPAWCKASLYRRPHNDIVFQAVPWSFTSILRVLKGVNDFQDEWFRVQRSGLKKSRQFIPKGLCLHLIINPFHSMGYDGHYIFWIIFGAVSIGCNLWTLNRWTRQRLPISWFPSFSRSNAAPRRRHGLR